MSMDGVGGGCCVSSVNSPNLLECPGQEQAVVPANNKPRRRRLASRMSSSLRRSSTDLISSFSLGVTDTIDEVGGGGNTSNKSSIAPRSRHTSVTGGMLSTTDVAALVADEYFAEEEEGQQQQQSGLFSVPSLLDESFRDNTPRGDSREGGKTDSPNCSSSNRSTPSQEDVVALEVGISAHEYLEECFYTEVSVLNREKFDAIPEVVKSDFAIICHLGKGSFSDVFEVASKIGKPLANTKTKATRAKSMPDDAPQAQPAARRRPSRARRTSLSSSITVATLSRPSRVIESRPIYAMKCLRPQIRSNADQFTIGAEDLVHETAILCNLDHVNIIKVHGRASGSLADAFVLNDGYFILLDKLKETLQGRIDGWKRSPKCMLQGPTVKQIDIALSISDAVTYLHSKNIVFRDLKPANVGFDANGVLKLFDFGFAIGLPEKDKHINPEGHLFDRCGTPRYMAPEVGLTLGYGLPADVYSFGILLWEMFSFTKPFASIKSANEFESTVFVGGQRPTMENRWPSIAKELMESCWCASPIDRPAILDVKSTLSLLSCDEKESSSGDKKIRSIGAIRSKVSRSIVW